MTSNTKGFKVGNLYYLFDHSIIIKVKALLVSVCIAEVMYNKHSRFNYYVGCVIAVSYDDQLVLLEKENIYEI